MRLSVLCTASNSNGWWLSWWPFVELQVGVMDQQPGRLWAWHGPNPTNETGSIARGWPAVNRFWEHDLSRHKYCVWADNGFEKSTFPGLVGPLSRDVVDTIGHDIPLDHFQELEMELEIVYYDSALSPVGNSNRLAMSEKRLEILPFVEGQRFKSSLRYYLTSAGSTWRSHLSIWGMVSSIQYADSTKLHIGNSILCRRCF